MKIFILFLIPLPNWFTLLSTNGGTEKNYKVKSMVNRNVNSWEFSKSTWVDFNVTAGYMWCNLLLMRLLQRFFQIRCACNISQQWASCPIARAKSKCKIGKSGSSNYGLYDVFHNYYQLKTDWEVRDPALFLIWNTICLTWFRHRSTGKKKKSNYTWYFFLKI